MITCCITLSSSATAAVRAQLWSPEYEQQVDSQVHENDSDQSGDDSGDESAGGCEKKPPFRCQESCDCNTNDCYNHKRGIICLGDKCTSISNHCSMQSYIGLEGTEFENVEIREEKGTVGSKMRGLYARRPFEDGQPIMLYAGDVLTKAEMRGKQTERSFLEPCPILTNYVIQMDIEANPYDDEDESRTFYIDPYEKGNCGGLANSLNGNNNCHLRKVCPCCDQNRDFN